MVEFKNVCFSYSPKTPMEFEALSDVSLSIEEGSFTAIVGRTGCGKSTLIQHINALLNPTSGEVVVFDFINASQKKKRNKNVKALRKKIGMVFQFPEYQLFEETVEKDVAFAPKNFGMNEEDAIKAAHEALSLVGLGEDFYSRSPFELSGGEKRRVAIAGILAFKPSVLIIDEPTAGLDPQGGKDIMDLFKKIHEEGTTIILVTHDMDVVLNYADTVIVMDDGKVIKKTTPSELFLEPVEPYSLQTPSIYRFAAKCNERGANLDISKIGSLDDLVAEISAKRRQK